MRSTHALGFVFDRLENLKKRYPRRISPPSASLDCLLFEKTGLHLFSSSETQERSNNAGFTKSQGPLVGISWRSHRLKGNPTPRLFFEVKKGFLQVPSDVVHSTKPNKTCLDKLIIGQGRGSSRLASALKIGMHETFSRKGLFNYCVPFRCTKMYLFISSTF